MNSTRPVVIKPRALAPGATIGIVAPASPFARVELMRGLAVLRDWGFGIRLAEDLFARKRFLAGDDRLRAAQLHGMFEDQGVHAIMCARGGYGALRLLQMLDFDLIRRNPKPFIGFSDICFLHQALFQRTGLVTFHGPMVCTLADSDAATHAAWRRALQSGSTDLGPSKRHRMIKPGKAEGLFFGGNLAALAHLCGTPFAFSLHGCILLLEDIGERPYRIDRMLMQMKLAGRFEGLAGLVLGSFKDCGAQQEIDDIVRQQFDDQPIPIMAGVAAGHGKRNITLPLGVIATLDANEGTLHFAEAATVD